MPVKKLLSSMLVAIAFATGARAGQLPPLTPDLLDTAGVLCVKVSRAGIVSGAFILVSTGNARADRDLVAWVKQLHWDPAAEGASGRDIWFPMPVAFGQASPPAPPESCAPPAETA